MSKLVFFQSESLQSNSMSLEKQHECVPFVHKGMGPVVPQLHSKRITRPKLHYFLICDAIS